MSRFAAKTMLDGATATSTAEAAAAGMAGAGSWERLAAAAELAGAMPVICISPGSKKAVIVATSKVTTPADQTSTGRP